MSRTITFDDIGSNAIWFGGIGYGGVPPGYAGFVWTFTNYINVTQNTLFGASLKSGTFVAYNDNTNASNKLKVTTNNSALFYIRSMTVASVIPAQTPFIIWGIRSGTIIHSMSITITAASASELQFSTWEEAVDTIEMFAYNNTFSFDDLVMSGPF